MNSSIISLDMYIFINPLGPVFFRFLSFTIYGLLCLQILLYSSSVVLGNSNLLATLATSLNHLNYFHF